MKIPERVKDFLRILKWKWKHRDYLLVFNWHQVTPSFDPAVHHVYTWTRLEDFASDVDWVASAFRVLSLHRAIDLLKRGELRGACAAITFDDGDVSVADHVVPWLQPRGIPATLFINTAYLEGNGSYWFPVLSHSSSGREEERPQPPGELLEKGRLLRTTTDPVFYDDVRSRLEKFAVSVPRLEKRLVTPDWLSALDGEQFSIGAHGHEHQRYSMMSADWQRNDLSENVRRLSRFRGFRPIFAVPFGREHDWTGETIRIAREQGLEVVLADGGVNFGGQEVYRRISCDGRKTARLFRQLVTDHQT